MDRYHEKYHISIIAYCFMPNHYHFLVRQDSDLKVSCFINTVFNSYVQAVNGQCQRSGPLFQGRFRHSRIDRDEYLIHLCRYIHLNPVRAGMVSRPEDWSFSDCAAWVKGLAPIPDCVRMFLPEVGFYRRFLEDRKDSELDSERISRYILD